MTFLRLPFLLFFLLSLGACSQTPAAKDELYQQLGAQAGLEQLVDGLLLEIEQDQQIVHHFKTPISPDSVAF